MAGMVCKHCGLEIYFNTTNDAWAHTAHLHPVYGNSIYEWYFCDYAAGLDTRTTDNKAEPSDSKFLIEDVPVPVAKFKTTKAKKTKKIEKVAISGETLCKHCGLEIQLADGKWEHKQDPQYYSCNFAAGDTNNYPGTEVAEPYEYVLEKVITENPVCKHCGLGIHPCAKNVGGGKTSNKTGWKHSANANGVMYNCCRFATDNKAFILKLQAEPSMMIESVPEVVEKAVEKAVVPESTETCMYCNAPVKLLGSESAYYPNDWTHTSTGKVSCWTSMTLDGEDHAADTLNQQNEYSKDTDKSDRTAFFQFLKNHFNTGGPTVHAAISIHSAHEVNGRKFRIQHD